jgi:site-specific recombinase XerD
VSLAEIWRASDPTKRESTTAREELTLRLHVLPAIGDHRIDRVEPDEIQSLVNGWSSRHAPRTVKRNYEVARAMFGHAVRNDWLARNPCRNVKLPTIESTRRYELTPDDASRIADEVPIEPE